MDNEKLSCQKRDVFGKKTEKGRKSGLVPAVLYGKGVENQSLWIKELDFSRLLGKVGESSMLSLEIEGRDNQLGRNVIIYEIQRDSLSDKIIHADFFQVKMDEEIETEVELEYVGQSPAVLEQGGVLVKNMDEIEVKCLPADLPSKIEVDISGLKSFDDYIYVKDLKISKKIKISLDPETVLALVTPPRSEEELSKLEEKVEGDVSKVEGVVKEENENSKEEEKDKKE
jgi:large subunit ribosomal protein L25